jgi:prepilin-type N-terminal cleavage/methylation domain-containing protein
VVRTRCNNKGFTLVELAIVIAVLAILTLAATKGIGWIQQAKVRACVEQTGQIRQAATWYKSANPTWIELTESVNSLISAQVLKANNAAGDDFVNPYGGAYEVGPKGGSMADIVVLRIVSPGIPDALTCGYIGSSLPNLYGSKVTTLCQQTPGVETYELVSDFAE